MYTGRSEHHRMAPVDLLSLVQESIGLLHVTKVAACEIICEFPPEPIFALGDRAEIQQIILNILINSAEAHATKLLLKAAIARCEPAPGAQGEVTEPREFIEFSLTDNGEGMTPEVLARIFEPFYSTRFTGRGLGLPAAMGLVRAHEGSMTVESTQGTGTTIRLRIPAARGKAVTPPKPKVVDTVSTASRTVLIAEDEAIVRNTIVTCMGRLGWKTIEAVDGEEAVRAYRDHVGKIDLLLCDYLMPKVNGLEAARQIRGLSPDLPVIIMSGFTNEATVDSFRTEGFEHFLKKPFMLDDLRDRLKAVSLPGSILSV